MPVYTGAKARLAYGIETTFKGGGTASNAFGVGQRLTGLSGRNSIERIYELGKRDAARLVAMRFEGTWGVEAIMGNTTWKDAIFTSTGGAVGVDPKSLVIEVGFSGAQNVLRTLKGAVIRRLSIGARVNEPVRLRFDGVYATETVSTPTSITPVSDTTAPYTFAGATVTFAGQTVANVQSLDVDITTGYELVYALGARTARDMFGRAFEIEGRFSATAISSDFVKYMLGLGSGTDTEPKESGLVTEVNLVATFTNGTNTMTLTIPGVIGELGSAIEANELIMFDVAFTGRTATISVA